MYVMSNYKVYAVDKANTDENSFFLSTLCFKEWLNYGKIKLT